MFRKILFVLVLCLALALRLYRLDSPMWLDEIYGYRLAKLGVQAIIKNSWTDPHLPLYYLMQWVVSGFGQIKSAWGWRILPLVFGVLTLFPIWLATRKTANYFSSILCCLVAATSPSLIFYSQEARPYALVIFAASISTWLTIYLLENPTKISGWIAWTMVSLVGLYTGYSYVMIAGTQMAFLAFHYCRLVAYLASTSVIVCGAALLIPFANSSLQRTATFHKGGASLTLWRTLQTLSAGEPIRYGYTLAHMIFPMILIGLSILSFVKWKRLRDQRLAYILTQVFFPLALFFSIRPFLNISLPPLEARQFLVLLPAMFILIGNGFAELNHRFSNHSFWATAAPIALCTGMLFLNLVSLKFYWTIPKSPEGLAILDLQRYLQPGERIVSLHYSTNYALGFYISNAQVYLNPTPVKQSNSSYYFQMVDSDRLFEQVMTAGHNQPVSQIRANRRFWLLAHATNNRDAMRALFEKCQIKQKRVYSAMHGSFELMLVECPSE